MKRLKEKIRTVLGVWPDEDRGRVLREVLALGGKVVDS